ncbi:MAG: HTTM domain-containing protein [Planctomycetota bacterium]
MAGRLAAFRFFLALTTLRGAPGMHKATRVYLDEPAPQPVADWIPALPVWFAGLVGLGALFMLVGRFARVAAAALVLLFAWFLAADIANYGNNRYFHLVLLIPLVFLPSTPIERLCNPRLEPAPAPVEIYWWIRVQAAIAMLYAAVDKVTSPDWPAKLVATYDGGDRLQWLSFVERGHAAFVASFPHVAMALVVAVEFALGIGLLLRRGERFTALLGLAFCMHLLVLLDPGMFSWDMAAVFCLLLPAGTRDLPARKPISLALDWYRRLRFDADARTPALLVLLRLPVALYLLFFFVERSWYPLGADGDRVLVLAGFLIVAALFLRRRVN